jgi:hypothetical protein
MLHQFSKSFLAVIALSIALTVAACGTGEAEEDIEPISSTEAQTAPETEIIDEPTPTPSPTPLPTPTDLPTEITEPVSPIQPVSPLKEPAMAPSNGEVQVLSGSEAVLAAAVANLSEKTGTPASEISLVSMEAVDWSDASLGCPQEGYMYAQVITPGFLIVLEAQGQPYEYHTDRTGNVVLCEA